MLGSYGFPSRDDNPVVLGDLVKVYRNLWERQLEYGEPIAQKVGKTEGEDSEQIRTLIPVKGASLPSLVTMKERVGSSSSNTVPNLRILTSSSPTFLTLATTLRSDTDATLLAGVDRETSRPPTARVVGLA